jgi:hypothetical protein
MSLRKWIRILTPRTWTCPRRLQGNHSGKGAGNGLQLTVTSNTPIYAKTDSATQETAISLPAPISYAELPFRLALHVFCPLCCDGSFISTLFRPSKYFYPLIQQINANGIGVCTFHIAHPWQDLTSKDPESRDRRS